MKNCYEQYYKEEFIEFFGVALFLFNVLCILIRAVEYKNEKKTNEKLSVEYLSTNLKVLECVHVKVTE